jgi:hypothetical protein
MGVVWRVVEFIPPPYNPPLYFCLPTPNKIIKEHIREENLLQMVLWKTVHFALFLVKISINFSPGYSCFFHHSVRLYFTIISKFYYKNFKIFVQCFNE